MSRRGLVSKESPSQGGAALMAKGGKPPKATALAVEEVANSLKVNTTQVLEWMHKDKLRGTSSGIKPYDLKKFELDYQSEIRDAQAKALADSQKVVKKKASKQGFFSRLFKREPKAELAATPSLIQENLKLKEELKRARQTTGESSSSDLSEDKIKFLEGRLAKMVSVEQEVISLKQELKISRQASSATTANPELEQQLQSQRLELERAKAAVKESEPLKAAILKLRSEREELQGKLKQAEQAEQKLRQLQTQLSHYQQAAQQASFELDSLKQQLKENKSATEQNTSDYQALQSQLSEYQKQIQQKEEQTLALQSELTHNQQLIKKLTSEKQELKENILQRTSEASSDAHLSTQLTEIQNTLQETRSELEKKIVQEQEYKTECTALQHRLEGLRLGCLEQEAQEAKLKLLIDELLNLQEANLGRYQHLHKMHQETVQELASKSAALDLAASSMDLSQEVESLKDERARLSQALISNELEQKKLISELDAVKTLTSQLQEENLSLQEAKTAQEELMLWKVRVEELEARLAENISTSSDLEEMETEVRLLRKTLQSREAQVQKVALRFQENERALQKALKESSRLTELLILREKSLNELRSDYEQEYREKMDSLDRQVSGLQWKLSLREERIASLESEVSQLKRQQKF